MELKAENISKVYSGTTVLEDVSFVLTRGQKVGLVGNNGTGKTTLLKILAGLVEPDSGKVFRRSGTTIGYMPQDTSLVASETVRAYLRHASGITALENRLGHDADALNEYERRDGYTFDHRLGIILAGFGLRKLDEVILSALSSGQKSKVFLAGVLLSDPDVLLLDEPTNNLDLPALIWLEDYLVRSQAACIIVSHDRRFLDRLVRKIFEIEWFSRNLVVHNGKYSDYLKRLAEDRKRIGQEHEAQQEEIRRLSESAKAMKVASSRGSNFSGNDNDKFRRGFQRDRAGKSGRTARAVERRIAQMEIIERPVERDAFRIRIHPAERDGSRDITLDNVSIGYSKEKPLVGEVTLSVGYGDRLVILGMNGTGKTALLKTIASEIPPLSGSVTLGKALVVGNLMQEHDNLSRELTLSKFLMQRAMVSKQEAYALIVQHGFTPEEFDKQIAVLSPGGRARLLIALFSALSVNMLFLDEPTNHLDLEAVEALEEMIEQYEGTVILVSHDRYFLEKVHAPSFYVLSKGRLNSLSSFDEYLTNAEREAQRLMDIL